MPVNFQPYISKVVIAMAVDNKKDLYEKNNSCHPVTLEYFSIQLLVNSEIVKLLINLFITHLRAQGRRFEPCNALGYISRQFENFEIYMDLYGKPFKLDWVAKVVFLIQIRLILGGHCNRDF